jgi:hypothetical protein
MEGSVRCLDPRLKLSKSITATRQDVSQHFVTTSLRPEYTAARLAGLLRVGEKGIIQSQALMDDLSSGGLKVRARPTRK